MKILLLGVALALAGCSSDAPVKSEQAAINDVRAAFDTDDSDSNIRGLLTDTCTALDKHSPQELQARLDVPPALVKIVLDNAVQAFCPEHRKEVVDYLAG